MSIINVKTSSLFIVVFFCFSLAFGQRTKELKIGDKCPEALLTSLLNYSKNSALLSEFRGQPLLLDFWFIGCTSCVEAMPYMDSLQRENKGKLQILLVTRDKKQRVEKFLSENRHVRNVRLTQVVGDSILHDLFPTRIMPHQVWIDSYGTVVAITDGKTSTRQNIQKFLKGEKFDFIPKTSEILSSFIAWGLQPLMLYEAPDRYEKLLFYSYFSKFQKQYTGVTVEEVLDSVNKLVRFRSLNSNFLSLYDYAYSGASTDNANTFHKYSRMVRLDTTSVLTQADYINFTNVFCYDLIYKATNDRMKVSRYMISDLDRYFNVKSSEEIRKVKCLIIRESGSKRRYQESMDNGQTYISKELFQPNDRLQVYNIRAVNLVFLMNQVSPLPVVNETGYDGKFSFEVTWQPTNTVEMSAELRKFGLEVVTEERDRKVIVTRNP